MDKEEIYLKHLSGSIISSSQWKLSYLGFLVTVNIAIYGGVYLLNKNGLWDMNTNPKKLFLVLLLVFVNTVFLLIYLREHNLSKIRKDVLLDYLQNQEQQGAVDNNVIKMRSEIELKDKMRDATWLFTKILFAVFSSIVLAFLTNNLLVHIQSSGFNWNGYGWEELLFTILFVLFGFVIYLFLSCKEYKKISLIKWFINFMD